MYVSDITQGYGGTSLHGIFITTPADPSNPGTPDYWAYCVEHDVSADTDLTGLLQDPSAYLGAGENYFGDPAIQAKVRWVLAHSYPYLSLSAFGAAAGVPNISVNDAIEATQYAIWRYTELTFDAAWNFEDSDSEAAYWYLLGTVNANPAGLTDTQVQTTATVTGPSGTQTAGSLIGPFTVSTNQASASVTASSGYAVTDASGTAIDTTAVVDGQQLYLDLRGTTAAGSATLTVSASGSGITGDILSIPTTPGGTPTAGSHAQTLIVVPPSTAAVTDSATVSWSALPVPSIGTMLTDTADGDHALSWHGGTLTDTVSYHNLTPGTSYTLAGTLMDKAKASATGIIGAKTFTPTSSDGSVGVTFTVPAGYAGRTLVAFERLTTTADASTVVAEHEDLASTDQTVTVSKAPAPSKSHPTITTHTSSTNVLVGRRIGDRVRMTGFTPGGTAIGSATLYGPYASRAAATCTKATVVKAVSFTPHNGVVNTAKVAVTKPGYYTWVASTTADAHNTAASHRCGLAAETTLVHKAGYGAPIVDTGFSGVEPDAALGWRIASRIASTTATVTYAAVGASATTSMVGVSKGAVQVPGNVRRLGMLAASAGIGDAIGNTVIVGHVSDDHDSPGAFYHLAQAKRGQIIKVTEAGTTYKFRVTSTKTYSRAHNGHPPAPVFSTVGPHKLVLISCADKVVYPNGHFHYTRNIVVTATPIK